MGCALEDIQNRDETAIVHRRGAAGSVGDGAGAGVVGGDEQDGHATLERRIPGLPEFHDAVGGHLQMEFVAVDRGQGGLDRRTAEVTGIAP